MFSAVLRLEGILLSARNVLIERATPETAP
jgi:hypothetical protein